MRTAILSMHTHTLVHFYLKFLLKVGFFTFPIGTNEWMIIKKWVYASSPVAHSTPNAEGVRLLTYITRHAYLWAKYKHAWIERQLKWWIDSLFLLFFSSGFWFSTDKSVTLLHTYNSFTFYRTCFAMWIFVFIIFLTTLL